MITNAIWIMGLMIVANLLQRNFKIPAPVTLMSVVLGAMATGYPVFKLNSGEFDQLVLLTLPLLIASDALKLRVDDLKEHGWSLFWVAVISVVMAIGVGVLINDWVLVDYPLSIAAVILLFCMVSATDPITVSAIFGNFKVPHRLKVITEGESLLNDATALIIFSLALVALKSPQEVTAGFIAWKSVSVIVGAVIVGSAVGWITTQALKLSDEALTEATIIVLSAYVAYMAAEKFHWSGILAVIVSTMVANEGIQKAILKGGSSMNPKRWVYSMTTRENETVILKSLDFVGLFASSVLFISIASIVNLDRLWFFKYEILAVFIASTLIRGLMMLKFAWISQKTNRMHSIKKHWWAVLTFAGSKGALSILMVHLIPSSFEYKELFENIIVGTILLSTFAYSVVLAWIFMKNKELFEKECENEVH